MDLLSGALGPEHAGAALLLHPVARDWLALPPPAAPLHDRLRRAALCIAVHGDGNGDGDGAAPPALLAPCFILDERLALCVRVGPLHPPPPPHAWWALAPAPPAARAVVDLRTNALIEAHVYANTQQSPLSPLPPPPPRPATAAAHAAPPQAAAAGLGGDSPVDGDSAILLRVTVAVSLPLRHFPFVTVVAVLGANAGPVTSGFGPTSRMATASSAGVTATSLSPSTAVAPGSFAATGAPGAPSLSRATTMELVYRRDCSRCNPTGLPCQCMPSTSLESASPPPADPSAPPISPSWHRFASRFHNVFHGSFTVTTSIVPGAGAHGVGLHAGSQPTAFGGPSQLLTSHHRISVTMNDRLAGVTATPQPLPTPPPRRLLPRPEPAPPATSSI